MPAMKLTPFDPTPKKPTASKSKGDAISRAVRSASSSAKKKAPKLGGFKSGY